jgi:hypothetical protein
MIERLARILLAFAVAFVFTGRMEAAAQHCAQLAQAEAAVVEAAKAAPCHEDAHPAAPEPSPHDVATEKCECIAVLVTCVATPAATASSLMAPYAWMRPEAVTFASVEPAPDRRPPRV